MLSCFKDFQSSTVSITGQGMVPRQTEVTCKYLKGIHNKLTYIKYLVYQVIYSHYFIYSYKNPLLSLCLQMKKQRHKRLSNLSQVIHLRIKKLIFESEMSGHSSPLSYSQHIKKTLHMVKCYQYTLISFVTILGDQALTSDLQYSSRYLESREQVSTPQYHQES